MLPLHEIYFLFCPAVGSETRRDSVASLGSIHLTPIMIMKRTEG